MPFPYSQSKTYEINSDDYAIDQLPHNISTTIDKAIQSKGIQRNEDWYVSTNSLFNIPFKFKVNVIQNEKRVIISYKLHLHNLVNGVLIINLLTAFFSKFQFESYLWFVLVASIIFYGLSWLIIVSGIKNMTLSFFAAYKIQKYPNDDESTNNVNYTYHIKKDQKCPACHAEVKEKDLQCPSCGIKLKQNPYTKPLDL